jgi:hypothetical protein
LTGVLRHATLAFQVTMPVVNVLDQGLSFGCPRGFSRVHGSGLDVNLLRRQLLGDLFSGGQIRTERGFLLLPALISPAKIVVLATLANVVG